MITIAGFELTKKLVASGVSPMGFEMLHNSISWISDVVRKPVEWYIASMYKSYPLNPKEVFASESKRKTYQYDHVFESIMNKQALKTGFINGLAGVLPPAFTIPAAAGKVVAQWVTQAEVLYAVACIYGEKPDAIVFLKDLYGLIGGKEIFKQSLGVAKVVWKEKELGTKLQRKYFGNDISTMVKAIAEKMLGTDKLAKVFSVKAVANKVLTPIAATKDAFDGYKEIKDFAKKAQNYYHTFQWPKGKFVSGEFGAYLDFYGVDCKERLETPSIKGNVVVRPLYPNKEGISLGSGKYWVLNGVDLYIQLGGVSWETSSWNGPRPEHSQIDFYNVENKLSNRTLKALLTGDEKFETIDKGSYGKWTQIDNVTQLLKTWMWGGGTSAPVNTPAVIGSFKAEPADPLPNKDVKLSWKGVKYLTATYERDALSIDQGVGKVEVDKNGDGSKMVKAPASGSKKWTLTAVGGGVVKTATATVNVKIPVPVIGSFTAYPPNPTPNSEVKLSWSGVTGANKTLFIADVGIVTGTTEKKVKAPSTPGSKTWTLKAIGDGGETTKKVTVTVLKVTVTPVKAPDPVVIGNFTVTPNNPLPNQQVKLSWSGVTGHKAISIDNGVGNVTGSSGSKIVKAPASGSKTWTLKAIGIGSTKSLTATVKVQASKAVSKPIPAPSKPKLTSTPSKAKLTSTPSKSSPVIIGRFTASPSNPAPNQQVTLLWSGISGANKSLAIIGVGSIRGASGSKTVKAPSSGSKTWTLTAAGNGGRKSLTARVTVQAPKKASTPSKPTPSKPAPSKPKPPPSKPTPTSSKPSPVIIGRFTASPANPAPNQQVTLSWSGVSGANRSLTIAGVGSIRGASGSKTVKAPSSGSKTWTLTAAGNGGRKSLTARVTVQAPKKASTPSKPTPSKPKPPPSKPTPTSSKPSPVIIGRFTASPSNPAPNQQVTLSWSGVSGANRSLAIVGVGSVSGASGTKTVKAPSSGSKIWTLTAAGNGGRKSHTAKVTVQAPKTTSTPMSSTTRPVLRRGSSKKEDVKYLQKRLNALNNAKLNVTGNFGTGTLAAVKAFQQKKGLKVDGVVGPNTWAAIG